MTVCFTWTIVCVLCQCAVRDNMDLCVECGRRPMLVM